MQRIASRRIVQQGLAKGWNSWSELYFEQKREKQLLRQAAARLAKPQLVKCFSVWFADWEEVEATRRHKAEQERINKESKRLQAEAKAAKEEAQLNIQAAENARRDLERKEEEERQKRIAHLARMATRRMTQQEILRGWTTCAAPRW